MSDMHDAWFFIGVFVFIFLIWIATGGPLHPIAFTGPSLAQPQELGGGTYLQLPRAAFGIGHSNVTLPGSSNGSSAASTPPPLAGITFGSPSPYRDSISMNNYVSGAGSVDLRNEYLEIAVAQNASMPIDISGWKLVSEVTGIAAAIPKGTEVPVSGIVNPTRDIVLTAGERAMIISGRSPIGTSFRENKCIGYLSTFQYFSPQLPQNCPMPSDELVSFYGAYYIRDPGCMDYVNTLPRCRVVLSPSTSVSSACQNFVTKYLNYNGCVDAHKNDADFEGNTWHIYLGRFSSLWRTTHEVVKLLDINNKTVAAFTY